MAPKVCMTKLKKEMKVRLKVSERIALLSIPNVH